MKCCCTMGKQKRSRLMICHQFLGINVQVKFTCNLQLAWLVRKYDRLLLHQEQFGQLKRYTKSNQNWTPSSDLAWKWKLATTTFYIYFYFYFIFSLPFSNPHLSLSLSFSFSFDVFLCVLFFSSFEFVHNVYASSLNFARNSWTHRRRICLAF